jgi:uncharacterized protein
MTNKKNTNNKLLTKSDVVDIIKGEKKFLSDKYSISQIGIFGSYSRGEQKHRSDIDILVEFAKYPDLFTYVEIIDYLKSRLKRKVDLITKDALRVEIKNKVLSEVLYI